MMKIAKLIAVVTLGVLLAASTAMAADTIGAIEPQRVLFEHPRFADVQKRVQTVIDAKQKEAKSEIEKASDNQKKAEIYNQKKQEAAREEQNLMAPLFKEINVAIRTVAQRQKVTIVLDKTAIYYGGIDLTDDVIQELKKRNAGN